jgi:hypothetical protein
MLTGEIYNNINIEQEGNNKFEYLRRNSKIIFIFAPLKMVDVVQSVRTSDCGSEGRRFESGLPPHKKY